MKITEVNCRRKARVAQRKMDVMREVLDGKIGEEPDEMGNVE